MHRVYMEIDEDQKRVSVMASNCVLSVLTMLAYINRIMPDYQVIEIFDLKNDFVIGR